MGGLRAAAAAALVVLLGACSEDPGPAAGSDRDDPPPTSTVTPSPDEPGTEQSTEPDTGPTGAPDNPAGLSPEPALLDWRSLPGPVTDTVTVSGPWTLTVPEAGTSATLDGPGPKRLEAPERYRITDALIDGRYAVVVSEDTLAQRGNVATVVDLPTGDTFTLDESSPVPTTAGGTWALGEGRLLHATLGPERAYCLAVVDLATRSSERGWCAPPRHGFNDARITAAGTSLLTFDDSRPSCRTVVEVRGTGVEPLAGVADCAAWDALVVPGGSVWSVVPRASRIEEARFRARSGDSWFDLGPGTSGSLTWCAGAAYFVQDPQRDGDPARLLRWAPGAGLTVAYQTAGRGAAFLSTPRCGGDTLALSVLAESGDRQVAADVG